MSYILKLQGTYEDQIIFETKVWRISAKKSLSIFICIVLHMLLWGILDAAEKLKKFLSFLKRMGIFLCQ